MEAMNTPIAHSAVAAKQELLTPAKDLKLKVCGLREEENLKQVMKIPPDLIGLIFHPDSPRFVEQGASPAFFRGLPPSVRKVGVFVNASSALIMEKMSDYLLDVVQLHGDESPEDCQRLRDSGIEVIKVFRIVDTLPLADLEHYADCCDYFLFDTAGKSYGGNGVSFDWELLKAYSLDIPYFLSGGISPEDGARIKELQLPGMIGVDINSRFEDRPGLKNIQAIRRFRYELKEEKPDFNASDRGYYGKFGGAFIPEMLYPNVEELRQNYLSIIESREFQHKFRSLLKDYSGRPTPLYEAKRLSEHFRMKIFLKREDLNHTGAHKVNNTIGQILLAKEMGKTRIIAETGAGQHGVATATVCALMGLECVVYMGEVDMARQSPNVARMRMLGAKVVPALSGSKTLKDATNEAIRDWINNPEETYYLIGSVVGPHPYPDLVARLQAIISEEIIDQLRSVSDRSYPKAVVACVGGGSNAAGAFYHFLDHSQVDLIAVEAAGKGIRSGYSAATVQLGTPGILHGSQTLLMQNQDGQVTEPHSISAGLDYPGIGPLHAHLFDSGRARFLAVTDEQALEAALLLARLEGIIPALESAHALACLANLPYGPEDLVVVNLSGRGDKDLATYTQYLDAQPEKPLSHE